MKAESDAIQAKRAIERLKKDFADRKVRADELRKQERSLSSILSSARAQLAEVEGAIDRVLSGEDEAVRGRSSARKPAFSSSPCSAVIAIVLFGIIGELEGKELFALLGGLSGYILGRANMPMPSSPPGEATVVPKAA